MLLCVPGRLVLHVRTELVEEQFTGLKEALVSKRGFHMKTHGSKVSKCLFLALEKKPKKLVRADVKINLWI